VRYRGVTRIAFAVALITTSPALGQPMRSPPAAIPAAMQIFERDWVLMNWALKFYDTDRDILLEPEEAQAAAEGFRRIADANGDGRVSPEEFRAAREFILARY
jgi:hypothetical protein